MSLALAFYDSLAGFTPLELLTISARPPYCITLRKVRHDVFLRSYVPPCCVPTTEFISALFQVSTFTKVSILKSSFEFTVGAS